MKHELKALFLAVLGSVSTAVSAQAADGGGQVATMESCCSSQGIIDDPHRVTATVDDDDPNTPARSVTASLPATSGPDDFAGVLAYLLMECGIDASSGPPSTEKFRNQDDKAEEVRLPSGYHFTDVEVEKLVGDGWQTDDGHLKAWVGDTKVSGGPPPPGPILTDTYTTFDFKVSAWQCKPIVFEIHMFCQNLSDGSLVEHYKKIVYPTQFLPVTRLQGIGDYLDRLGMTVSYPSSTELHVEITPSGLAVYEVHFALYEETDANSGPTWNASYRFIPQ